MPPSPSASLSPPPPLLLHWLLDTRPLYPAAHQTADLATHAARALALLAPAERAAVLRFVRPADAKMSLASHLLKRYAVARHVAGVSWARASPARDARTKPVFVSPPAAAGVAFNVSHQAGVVVLAGVVVAPPPAGADDGALPSVQDDVDVGVDVVSPTERRHRDRAMVAADGWPAFVDMHADVFAPAEAAYLKWAVLGAAAPGELAGGGGGGGGGAAGGDVLDYKLRAFYTLWCLREAYVKMTGEALLAEWLGVLEFRGFRPPPPPPLLAAGRGGDTGDRMRQGKAVTTHDILFRGEKVQDANVCIRTVGEDYMVCTAVRTPGRPEIGLAMELGEFEFLDLEDILSFAESQV